MAWDFIPPELRATLQPTIDKGEELVRIGAMTRAQGEAILREMMRLALLVAKGEMSQADCDARVDRYVIEVLTQLAEPGGVA